jgi:hypothetical protein
MQSVSEMDGQILGAQYLDEPNTKLLTKMCPRTFGVFTVTTSDINTHENNSHFRHQYQWS